jgi:hypothetical protein
MVDIDPQRSAQEIAEAADDGLPFDFTASDVMSSRHLL